MDITLLKDGVLITIMGMGTVFFFLILLILAMNINEKVLKFLNKYFPETTAETNIAKQKAETSNEEIAIAIAYALRNK